MSANFLGRAVAAGCLCAGLLAAAPVCADPPPYPDHAVRLVVPFTPAGATDLLARLLGERLSLRLGKPVVVDNRPGAGANLGAALVAAAAPDGYTILMAPVSVYAISAAMNTASGYDLIRSFAPVSLVANVPHVLVVPADLPVRSVQELIALAKAQPGRLNLATQGTGTVSHLEAEMFKHMAAVDLVCIPYKGSAPALLDVTAGRVQGMFDSIASARPHIEAGKLRALAVTGAARSSLLPQVPTMAEAGLKDYRAESLLAIVAPARTPRPVIERLQRELSEWLQEPAARARLVAAGFEPVASTPDELAARMRSDLTRWAVVVKAAGATAQP
jgi:tripartite-type tricarboxylate transporter receptor subunit TctC